MIKKIDLKYATLPAGYTEESFMEIADSIHEQWAAFRDGSEEESGWGGDAGYGTPAAIFPRFKSFIVFVGSDTVFGFDDVNDRDCVLGDYYEDCQNLLNLNAKPNGSARIVIRKKEETEIDRKKRNVQRRAKSFGYERARGLVLQVRLALDETTHKSRHKALRHRGCVQDRRW